MGIVCVDGRYVVSWYERWTWLAHQPILMVDCCCQGTIWNRQLCRIFCCHIAWKWWNVRATSHKNDPKSTTTQSLHAMMSHFASSLCVPGGENQQPVITHAMRHEHIKYSFTYRRVSSFAEHKMNENNQREQQRTVEETQHKEWRQQPEKYKEKPDAGRWCQYQPHCQSTNTNYR